MKYRLDEVKRMQQLAGLIKENDGRNGVNPNNEYIKQAVDTILKEENFFGLQVGDKVKFKDSDPRSVAIIKYGVNPKTIFKIVKLHPGSPDVPDPNTHATLEDMAGNKINQKVYTGYLTKVDL